MSNNQTYLNDQLDGTVETFAELFAARDARIPYDDGSGAGQDPDSVLSESVMEVISLRTVRLLLSTGGPRVTGEVTIERDGRLSGHRLTAATPWDDVVRPVHPHSAVGRLLERFAEAHSPE